MPYDIHLADAMRSALKTKRGVTEKKMFGGICWMLNGNMLCGVEVGRYLFRVGKELQAIALEKPGVERMEMGGKAMSGFVWVDAKRATSATLVSWIDFAIQFVGTLPRK